jgi:hypothetical protein
MDGSPEARPELITPAHGRGKIAVPWTREEAIEAARKGGLARKGQKWDWESKARSAISRRLPSGERTGDAVLQTLVRMALEGDARSIELLAKISGWRPETIRRHEHALARDLRILPDGDARGSTPALSAPDSSVSSPSPADSTDPVSTSKITDAPQSPQV